MFTKNSIPHLLLALFILSQTFLLSGSTTKPEDIYRIIEHFSLGRRRLELFGAEHNIRSGWLTVGKDLSSSNFDSKVTPFLFYFKRADNRPYYPS